LTFEDLVFADARKQAKDDGSADETDSRETTSSNQAATEKGEGVEDSSGVDEQVNSMQVEGSSENTSMASRKVKQKKSKKSKKIQSDDENLENLKELTVKINKVLPNQCTICKDIYRSAKVLRRHIKSVHEKQSKFTCANCLQAFDSQVLLQQHKCGEMSSKFEKEDDRKVSSQQKRKRESNSEDGNESKKV
jgi:hypothetical protein